MLFYNKNMISAIILTWNSANYIEKCLRSLIKDAKENRIDIEIFVVDGGSNDGTLEILNRFRKEVERFNLIKLEKNLGTTKSRNLAIKESQGEYLLILDSDTEILPGALRRLFETLKEKTKAGIVSPRLIYPDGSVQISCKRFPTLLQKLCKATPFNKLKRLGEKLEQFPNKVYDKNFRDILHVDYCISACWLVRQTAREKIGDLDEKIFYAPEDVDYCLRMWLGGWEVLYVPTAEVIHYAQRRSYRDIPMALIHFKGLLYFFGKNSYALDRRRIYRLILEKSKKTEINCPFGIKI